MERSAGTPMEEVTQAGGRRSRVVRLASIAVAIALSIAALPPRSARSAGSGNPSPAAGQPEELTPLYGEVLEVGQSRTKTIRADRMFNWLHIGVYPGQKYRFTVASPEWNNGSRETTAAGYSGSSWIPGIDRRFPQYRWMALVAAVYGDDERESTYLHDSAFLIGSGRSSWTVGGGSGWLAAYANDCYACYGDNSRVVTLTIKRIE